MDVLKAEKSDYKNERKMNEKNNKVAPNCHVINCSGTDTQLTVVVCLFDVSSSCVELTSNCLSMPAWPYHFLFHFACMHNFIPYSFQSKGRIFRIIFSKQFEFTVP